MPYYKIDSPKKNGLQKYRVCINYTGEDGISRSLNRVVHGLEAAKKLEAKLNDEYKNTGRKKLLSAGKTLKEVFIIMIETKGGEGLKSTTIGNYNNIINKHILPTFGDTVIDDIDTEMVIKWKTSLNDKRLATSTKKTIYSDFVMLMNFAVDMNYINKSPLKGIKQFKDNDVKKEMEYYTREEFDEFIAAARNWAIENQNKHGLLSEWDYYIFFCIAFYTGLRKSEIHALTWTEIQNRNLTVKKSVTQDVRVRKGAPKKDILGPPKSRAAYRTIAIPVILEKILNEHKERQVSLGVYKESNLICGIDKWLRNATIFRRNRKFAELAGLKVIRVHDFRHSHVSVLINADVNIKEISRRVGHSNVQITWNTYAHMYPQQDANAANVFDNP